MNVPTLYLVSSMLTEHQKAFVRNALSITPVAGAIAASPDSLTLAYELTTNILLDLQDEHTLISKYMAIAHELAVPIAIIGDYTDSFRAIYTDAHQEVIPC